MPRVFISYRRDDSAYVAKEIYDELAGHYGADSVVFDVDTIPKGVDFVEYLNQQVTECDVLLAIIGDHWLNVQGKGGKRRIDDPEDSVRIEIQAALKRRIPVIPVLVGRASVPPADKLPHGLKQFSRRNAAEVRPGRDVGTHLGRLVQDIDRAVRLSPPRKPESEKKPGSLRRGRWLMLLTAIAILAAMLAVGSFSLLLRPTRDIITNSIGMQLKLIPAGSFQMGSADSDPHARDDEKPPHKVTLSEFELGIYQVTQAEYERVMKANPSKFQGDNRRPVEYVSWFETICFCNGLSELEGLPVYYDVEKEKVAIRDGPGYRLPTEAEWEYACRAGSDKAYCFGDNMKLVHVFAWYSENSGTATHPIGQKQPNVWGLHDMYGNVWEWCWDWYGGDYYRTSAMENPTGPTDGSVRVIRGGSWLYGASCCRSAYRAGYDPEGRHSDLGFRVARSVSGKSSK